MGDAPHRTQDRNGAASTPAEPSRLAWVSWALACAAMFATFAWAYWPTFPKLLHAWNVEPDYSHGYLVLPLAAVFLWQRRDRMPMPSGPAWMGLVLLAAGLAMNVAGSAFFIDSFDGWSMPLVLGGVCWLLGGWAFFVWCMPPLMFLWFMVPLPYRAEGLLSLPLQRMSTEISVWLLQCLGQPALAEGNVVRIGEMQLEVAQACSGLRIFMSIFALAFAVCVLARNPWWSKGLLFASVLPIAVLTNALRVTLTGLVFPHFPSEAARSLLHDVAGWLVIPLAALLIGALLLWLNRLVYEVETVSGRELLQSG